MESDGPRLRKLKLAYGKMVEQILQNEHLAKLPDGAVLEEELHAAFTRVLLKYEMGSKLKELDEEISKDERAIIRDVRDEEYIKQIFESYLVEDQEQMQTVLGRAQQATAADIAALEREEHSLAEEIAAEVAAVKKWEKRVDAQMAAIRRLTTERL